jgi:hypothetical protein
MTRKPLEVVLAKRRAYMARWRAENKELARSLTMAWRARSKDKIRSYSKKWSSNNRERARITRNQWNRRNPDKARIRVRLWKKNNPSKVLDNHNRRRDKCRPVCSKVRKINKRCVELKKWFDVVVDHIIPLSKGGTHTHDNLQIIYSFENSRKNDSMTYIPSVIFK